VGALGALVLAALVATACSNGGDDSDVVVIGERAWTPVILTSEQVIGKNRFVVGILDETNTPIVDGKVRLKFFDLTTGTPVERFSVDAPSRVPAREAGLTEQIEHIHSDGSKHIHVNQSDNVGYFVASSVDFDKAGNWGVEVALDSKDHKGSYRVAFNVIDQPVTPGLGSAAPRSDNPTAADVADIASIDSSAKPEPAFHHMSIAEAIAAGRPSLVLFAVPGYCDSRLCGPEYEIMKKLYPKYDGKAEFIHVEFYKEPGSPQRVVTEAAIDFKLRTEPWFFVIDGQGRVSAKFEGPATLSELDEALREAISQTASR
jgi:hypothetical protein